MGLRGGKAFLISRGDEIFELAGTSLEHYGGGTIEVRPDVLYVDAPVHAWHR